jgi:hypothetical protein
MRLSIAITKYVSLLATLIFGCSAALPVDIYQNGFPNENGFFPLAVWMQSPARAARYKEMGINVFVGLWEGPTEAQLAALAKYDMFAVAEQNDVGLRSVNRHLIKAWMQQDEPDNAQPIGLGLYGRCIPATQVVGRSREIKSKDPTRPVMINFGQGLANEYWKGRGPCNGDMKYYDVAIEDADILSFDIYPVGSSTPQVKGKLEYVARGVTNLEQRATPQQSVWNAIETIALDPNTPVTPAQVRSEVWMSLIHGSRGIVYFVTEFAPTFREDGIFRHPDVVQEVTKTNQLIKALAPIINSPSVPGKLTVTSQVPIATMVKEYEGSMYIFAVAMRSENTSALFRTSRVADGYAEVLDERRNVTISKGSFTDSFGGYSVHLYRIPIDRQG